MADTSPLTNSEAGVCARAFGYVLGGDELADAGLGSAPLCCVSQMMSWVRCELWLTLSEVLLRRQGRHETIEGTTRRKRGAEEMWERMRKHT